MICTSLERQMPVNGESKQWYEQSAICESNLKLILVFEKHPPVQIWKPVSSMIQNVGNQLWSLQYCLPQKAVVYILQFMIIRNRENLTPPHTILSDYDPILEDLQ